MPHLRFAAAKEQRVAVITGGARGLGRACALRIAEEGRHVVLADVLDEEASETVEAIQALGQDGFYCHTDVTDEQAVKNMIQTHFWPKKGKNSNFWPKKGKN